MLGIAIFIFLKNKMDFSDYEFNQQWQWGLVKEYQLREDKSISVTQNFQNHFYNNAGCGLKHDSISCCLQVFYSSQKDLSTVEWNLGRSSKS